MQSRNPALRNALKQAEADSAAGSSAGPPPPTGMPVMPGATGTVGTAGVTLQLPDVIAKTGLLFGILLVGSGVGWTTALTQPWIWIGAAVIALVLGLVNAFKRAVSPPLIIAYAIFEGIMLGGISQFYTQFAQANAPAGSTPQPLVLQAVMGTLVAFGVMLFLYSTKIIKVNGTFKKVFFIALISYGVISIISLVAAMFGVAGGLGFYGMGGLGIALCLFGVALAAFSLVMDFESISQGIAYGLPERESWRMGFGLMVTLVWLYLEILRLLAIVSANSR